MSIYQNQKSKKKSIKKIQISVKHKVGAKDCERLKKELEIIHKNIDPDENYHEGGDGTLYEESYIKKMLSNSLDIFSN